MVLVPTIHQKLRIKLIMLAILLIVAAGGRRRSGMPSPMALFWGTGCPPRQPCWKQQRRPPCPPMRQRRGLRRRQRRSWRLRWRRRRGGGFLAEGVRRSRRCRPGGGGGGGNTTTTDRRCRGLSTALPSIGSSRNPCRIRCSLPNCGGRNHNNHPCNGDSGNGNASGWGRAVRDQRGG